MSKRMIDEGALNAQIQNATTTKQDKLTPESDKSITIENHGTATVIASKIPVSKITTLMVYRIEAKTYQVGDIITPVDNKLDYGMFIGRAGTYDTELVVKFTGTSGIVALMQFTPFWSGTLNTCVPTMIVIKGGTVEQAYDEKVNIGILVANNAIYKR